jgi:hypothetical protein
MSIMFLRYNCTYMINNTNQNVLCFVAHDKMGKIKLFSVMLFWSQFSNLLIILMVNVTLFKKTSWLVTDL